MRILYEKCPLCESTNFSFLRESPIQPWRIALGYPDCVPKTVRWMKCDECGHVFTDGILSPEAFAAVIETPPRHSLSSLEYAFMTHVCERIVRRVQKHVPTGKWLDVGFGDAALMCAAKNYGFTLVGIDVSSQNVTKARMMGLDASLADVSDLRDEHSYNVISMADILEHTPQPKEVIRIVDRALKPNGALFISCPGYDSHDWRFAEQHGCNPYWSEIEHYHNFSCDRLSSLLKEFSYKMADERESDDRFIMAMELIFVRANTHD